MLIARNFNTYTRRKRDLFNSLTERRSMNATVIRNQEQMKKKNRTMAVIRRKERQIQMRRDIVDHVLKEAIKRFRYRTWIVLINFVKTGEHVLKTVRVRIQSFFKFLTFFPSGEQEEKGECAVQILQCDTNGKYLEDNQEKILEERCIQGLGSDIKVSRIE